MKKLPFELRVPVIQAPMAGANITTPELVAAVSNGAFAIDSWNVASLPRRSVIQGRTRLRFPCAPRPHEKAIANIFRSLPDKAHGWRARFRRPN